jgi:hypothetical protein
VPFPLPLAPELTVMKPSFDAAVHAHPDAAVTLTLPLLAVDGTLADAGASVNVQGTLMVPIMLG